MSDTTTITVPIDKALRERLEALSRAMQRSESLLVADAITEYVAVNAWQIDGIRLALEEIENGARGVPQEDVETWVRSWGTANELPEPRG